MMKRVYDFTFDMWERLYVVANFPVVNPLKANAPNLYLIDT